MHFSVSYKRMGVYCLLYLIIHFVLSREFMEL
jgi:hypothetical protein